VTYADLFAATEWITTAKNCNNFHFWRKTISVQPYVIKTVR